MRVSRITAGVALVVLMALVGSASPSSGLAPPPTQTATTLVSELCTNSVVPFQGLPEPLPFPPLPGPSLETVPVTLTVPVRVHAGATFDAFLIVDTSFGIAAQALLSGAPGVTPPVGTLFVFGTSLNGNLRYTATGRPGTLVKWRLNEFDVAYFVYFNTYAYFVVETCLPTASTVLASTRITGP